MERMVDTSWEGATAINCSAAVRRMAWLLVSKFTALLCRLRIWYRAHLQLLLQATASSAPRAGCGRVYTPALADQGRLHCCFWYWIITNGLINHVIDSMHPKSTMIHTPPTSYIGKKLKMIVQVYAKRSQTCLTLAQSTKKNRPAKNSSVLRKQLLHLIIPPPSWRRHTTVRAS